LKIKPKEEVKWNFEDEISKVIKKFPFFLRRKTKVI
jgi:hypothetical protein